ncbi:bicyclomycin resistance protein [Agromyces sp. Root81]|uniref:carbohydrate ABC transporter permease n=1 Tax=Agromyces sp. Root81 TaxID=1736601 RepID=UPI0006FE370A|nr:sugar ABC transporter permease [Agromyces sp. Root81]KRC59215.1 bicyclomycin resistance protein [Agromyces sp. Root81]
MADTSRTMIVWKRRLPGLIMTMPAVIVFTAMFLVPTVLGFVLSLTNWNGFSLNLTFIGFENYLRAFENPRSVDAAIFTTVFAVVTTVVCNLVGLALAVLIAGPGRANTVVRAVFFYPYIISALIIGFLWSAMLAPQGVFNSILANLGLPSIPFLTDPAFAQTSVIVTGIWAHYGFSMILYIAGLKSIPAEYYEAATVDGAGPWARFKNITVPLLAPIVTVNIVLGLVTALRVYDVVLALTAGGPAGSTETVVFQILKNSFDNGKLGYGAAQGVILLIVTAVLGIGVTLARRNAEKKVAD